MPYRSMMRLHPVKSIKHVVDARTAVQFGLTTTVPLLESVSTPALLSPAQVEDASTVSSIYLKVDAVATTDFTLQPAIYMIVYKDPANSLTGDPDPALAGISETKRFIIHQQMTMLSKDVSVSSFPRTIFEGVVRIPRTFKRNGLGDKLKLLLAFDGSETTGVAQVCIQCIYKEFR